ncbi:hypothetical protein J437_LFUL002723 [Ladona fulva]|uniref:Uncharacterized protein n=1 Tax=Ladona fulva TaxID=123851 RepID=A0A8K0K126_LADFU|nr:hypothetical protein J437_LFUL002723 [Ladona fulva]
MGSPIVTPSELTVSYHIDLKYNVILSPLVHTQHCVLGVGCDLTLSPPHMMGNPIWRGAGAECSPLLIANNWRLLLGCLCYKKSLIKKLHEREDTGTDMKIGPAEKGLISSITTSEIVDMKEDKLLNKCQELKRRNDNVNSITSKHQHQYTCGAWRLGTWRDSRQTRLTSVAIVAMVSTDSKRLPVCYAK